MRGPLAATAGQHVEGVRVDVLHAVEGGVAVRVRHEFRVLVRPEALLAVRVDGERVGRVLADQGRQLSLRDAQRARVVARRAIGDEDDEVSLAAVDDWADVSSARGRGKRVAGEVCRGRVVGRVSGVVAFHLAVAGIRRDAGEIAVHLAHRQRIGGVIALVAQLVEAADKAGKRRLVGRGHLADAEADISAVDVVVAAAGLDEHGDADVEAVRQLAEYGEQARLFSIEGLVPVRRVVDEDEHVRPLGVERRVGEEDVGVVVDRVEHRPAGLRHEQQRRGGDGTQEGRNHGISLFLHFSI